MTVKVLLLLAILSGFSSLAADDSAAPSTNSPKSSFNVRDFGAKGDGQSKDTAAIQKALDACAAAGAGTVAVSAGVYLIGSVVLGANTTLQLERGANLCGSPDINDYPLTRVRWEGEFAQGHQALLSANKADHIVIRGPGSILGPSLNLSRLRNPRGPVLIELTDCTNAVLEGFTTQYQQLWGIHLLFCNQFTARNLTLRSILVNGDGIDVDSCQGVLIEHCNIDTGDDAIALKSGRGLAAMRLGRPTQDVIIRDCVLVSSIFAGLALGTEMSGGIRNVAVENCIISGRQNGIFIKSRDGRGGFMEDITGQSLTIGPSPTFIGIDLVRKGIQASDPVPGDLEKWARVRNIRFTNVKLNQVAEMVAGNDVPPERPLDGFSLTSISGTCKKGITLANMLNVKLADITVTGFEGPLLTTNNVQMVGP